MLSIYYAFIWQNKITLRATDVVSAKTVVVGIYHDTVLCWQSQAAPLVIERLSLSSQ